jgi:D-alanyl-D-alanine carboxypeptidase
MDRWLAAALDYLPQWIGHQMRIAAQPGCVLAVAHKGRVVFEGAWGHADLARGEALTPRHRFRVASHSKTFTAAAVLKLRERGRLRLDDPVGRHVAGLTREVAALTVAQLLTHSAGLVRDGADAGQWAERRPFLDEEALREDLTEGPTIDPGTRFKYSNHGFGLLGLVIAAVTGEPYCRWVAREIVAAAGLRETLPDVPLPRGTPFACGHSPKQPLERRLVIRADMVTHALASATGFVASAADLARFFASLAPDARTSVLARASRQEMTRRQWRDPYGVVERWYGLGTIAGSLAGLDGTWDWFGHSGGFPGTLTRTACVPARQLVVSVCTNAADGLAHPWLDGALHILQGFARHGAPTRRTAPWAGRWWSLWGAWDLLPTATRVLVANPALQANPLTDASEIEPGARRGRTLAGCVALANGFASHGEPARLELDARARAKELWLGGSKLLPERAAARELERRYGGEGGAG